MYMCILCFFAFWGVSVSHITYTVLAWTLNKSFSINQSVWHMVKCTMFVCSIFYSVCMVNRNA